MLPVLVTHAMLVVSPTATELGLVVSKIEGCAVVTLQLAVVVATELAHAIEYAFTVVPVGGFCAMVVVEPESCPAELKPVLIPVTELLHPHAMPTVIPTSTDAG